ncbi:MAG: glycosyltransferase, partial [Parcubacteria group bacterium Gr01-1014_72]
RRLAYRFFDFVDLHRYIRFQDAIAVLDERDKEWVARYYGMRATVVRSGIDANAFQFQVRLMPTQSRLKLLTVGIFFRHRRFEDILAAITLLRAKGVDATLDIVGNDTTDLSYAREIRSLVASRGLTSVVHLRGVLSDDELRRAYKEADAFVFASHLQSWGLAVFEAIASGLPVIVSKTAGASEVLRDGETALLVPPKDGAAIARACERLLTEQGLSEKLSRSGRSFVEHKLSWGRYADAMTTLFTGRNQ